MSEYKSKKTLTNQQVQFWNVEKSQNLPVSLSMEEWRVDDVLVDLLRAVLGAIPFNILHCHYSLGKGSTPAGGYA